MTDLFSQCWRHTDPETSKLAALRDPEGRKTDRWLVLIYHSQVPAGMTDFELAAAMARQQTSAGKRRGELRDLGLVEATSQRRPAPSGSPAIVWRITDKGRRLIDEMVQARS